MSILESIPLPLIYITLIIWVLPFIRVIEAKTERWSIKAYFSTIWAAGLSILLFYEYFSYSSTDRISYTAFGLHDYLTLEFVVTKANTLLLAIISILFLSTMIFSIRYLKWESLLTDEGDYKLYYYLLLFISFLGVMVIIYANDLFVIFVGWEIMVLPAYALIAFRPRNTATEAGIKYALQSSIGSIFFLYGISTIYEIFGTFNLTLIEQQVTGNSAVFSNVLIWQAITFITAGIGVTAGFIGMQTWAPDAYGEGPSTVGAFISGTFATVSISVLFRTLVVPFGSYPQLGFVFLIIGILTMTIGNLGAIVQEDTRRLLGYSSIAQRGYLIFGLGLIVVGQDSFDILFQAVLAQALAYTLLEGILFLAIGSILFIHYQDIRSRELSILQGSIREHPLIAFGIIVAALGLAGLPPSLGFISKISLLMLAGFSEIHLIYVIIFVINSVISLMYYSNLIRKLIFMQPDERIIDGDQQIFFSMTIAILVLTITAVIMGVIPNIWFKWI